MSQHCSLLLFALNPPDTELSWHRGGTLQAVLEITAGVKPYNVALRWGSRFCSRGWAHRSVRSLPSRVLQSQLPRNKKLANASTSSIKDVPR